MTTYNIKNIAFYTIAALLFMLSILSFNNAYKEMQQHSFLTQRSIQVLTAYQELSHEITCAAISTPMLMKEEKAAPGADLFTTNSYSINKLLGQLNRLVMDTINLKIAQQLNTLIKSELNWLLKSNVQDSLLNGNSRKHITQLRRIDLLIAKGKARTHFLFAYREQQLFEAINKVKLRILIFLALAVLLVIFTTYRLIGQQVKRREKEKELDKQEKKFRAMVENTQDLILMMDHHSKVLYRSPSATRITGYTDEEHSGNPNLNKVHDDDREKIKGYLQQMKTEPGKVITASYRLKHKEGYYVWLEGTFTSMFHDPDLGGVVINVKDVSEKKAAEAELKKSEQRFRQTLENMLEGVQIIGFDWRYIYVNEALTKYSTYKREAMIGYTVADIYPGVEQTELYAVLKRCMHEREPGNLESEFVFPNGTVKFFELSIQPVPEGIFILSVDITERKKGEEEIAKLNRLYAFISAINQSIVHIDNDEELLKRACDIAVETGGFKLARIEMLERDGKLRVVSVSGNREGVKEVQDMSHSDYSSAVARLTPAGITLQTGNYAVNNDMYNDPELAGIKGAMERVGARSGIALPIKRGNKMIGIFTLTSSQPYFFDRREIELLLEAAGDISFACSVFEKTRQNAIIEEQMVCNEKRFRALIEKSTDLKTLTSSSGLFVYASPSVSKVFGYSEEEFLNKPAYDFFHPDNLQDLFKKRTEILDTPGAFFDFEYRVKHKNGHWVWVEGTLTNMLHEPAINALVSNFKDISEKKKAQEQEEFDRNNLNALINNTQDLQWSLDKSFRLITFNRPFYETIKAVNGKKLHKGDDVFTAALSSEQKERFELLYKRAFAGEIFSVVDVMEGPEGYAAEVSFYPVYNGDEIIGTACHSRDVSQRMKQEKERDKMLFDLTRYTKNLEQFGYVVSHNLRAPVANILGLTNLLNSSISKKDKTESQQHLMKAASQLDTIVIDLNKILDARALLGQTKEKVNLNDIVKSLKESIGDILKSEAVSLQSNFEVENLNSVKSYLFSIFYNLITNAIKYKQHNCNPVITIRSYLVNDKVHISFKDNGMGMDLKLYGNKVFGLYQRFHLDVSGKGMGLFMVKTQVEALDGTISLNSASGKGTEFIVELPL